MEIRAWITKLYNGGGKAAVSVELPAGGFTINQLHVKDGKGRTRITLPLSQHLHPYITLRGELKQAVFAAVEAAYRAAQAEGPEQTTPEPRQEGAASYAK